MKRIFLSVLFLFNIVFISAESAIKLDRLFFFPLVSDAGTSVSSGFVLNTEFIYPDFKTSVNLGSKYFQSSFLPLRLKHNTNFFVLDLKFFFAGFKFTVYQSNILTLKLPIKNSIVKEEDLLNNVYNIAFYASIPNKDLNINFDVLWAKPIFSMNSFYYFDGMAYFNNALRSKLEFLIQNKYKLSINYFNISGGLKNDLSMPFLFLESRGFANKYSVNFLPTENIRLLTGFAFNIADSNLRIRLNKKNQHYFLFPYEFNHRDFLIKSLVFSTKFNLVYDKKPWLLDFTAMSYSVASANCLYLWHSKKKKNILFDGKEESGRDEINFLTNNHLLLLKTSVSYRFKNNTKLSISKIIPIPILNKEFISKIESSEIHLLDNLDLLLSGLKVNFIKEF